MKGVSQRVYCECIMNVVSQRVYHEGYITKGVLQRVYCKGCIMKVVS